MLAQGDEYLVYYRYENGIPISFQCATKRGFLEPSFLFISSMSKKSKPKYIFVVGGVMSGVGKGITSSSIGKILQFSGYRVSAIKIDPYVNVDAGTMNPVEHGETFVLEDGHETDQDMGNYERFLNTSLTRDSYITTGSIYQNVINRERKLGYGGKTVQVVPDVPRAVIEQIESATKKEQSDITIIEIGGTVGEYENILFLEAARMMKRKQPQDILIVLVSYLPVPDKLGEMKTKPTQHAVRVMGETGVSPDFIVGRSPLPMDMARKEKIAAASLLHPEDIISAPNLDSIYDVPHHFISESFDSRMLKKLSLRKRNNKEGRENTRAWSRFTQRLHRKNDEVRIAIVGKYFATGDFVLSDAYVSIIEALKLSAVHSGISIHLDWLHAQDFEGPRRTKQLEKLKTYDGVLIPGGFGSSGIEGKINVVQYVREKKIPFFGICLGMQMASVEFARNVLGLEDAHTTEVKETAQHPVITIPETQAQKLREKQYGASMRLGSYPGVTKSGTIARKIYKKKDFSERHRHRYELNTKYAEAFKEKGFVISATSPDGTLPEIIELPQDQHPFFIGVQFHPELQARPLDPHPLFTAFLKASRRHMR